MARRPSPLSSTDVHRGRENLRNVAEEDDMDKDLPIQHVIEESLLDSRGSNQSSTTRSDQAASSSAASSSLKSVCSSKRLSSEKNTSCEDLLKKKAKQQAYDALKNIGLPRPVKAIPKEMQLSTAERAKQRRHQETQGMAKEEAITDGSDAARFTRTSCSMDDPKDLEALEVEADFQRRVANVSLTEMFTRDENVRNKVLSKDGDRWQDWPTTAAGQQIPLKAEQMAIQRENQAVRYIEKEETQVERQVETQSEWLNKLGNTINETKPSQSGLDFRTQLQNVVNASEMTLRKLDPVQQRFVKPPEAMIPTQASMSTGSSDGTSAGPSAGKWGCKTDEARSWLEEAEEEEEEENN